MLDHDVHKIHDSFLHYFESLHPTFKIQELRIRVEHRQTPDTGFLVQEVIHFEVVGPPEQGTYSFERGLMEPTES